MDVQSLDEASLLLESGFSAVLQMPTGSGKTWRAAQAIRACVARGRKAIYVSPTRALANELYQRWSAEWSGVRCGIFTGDYSSDRQSSEYGSAEVLVMTPEKLDLISRMWKHHWHWIPALDLVVFDEAHLLGDPSRGGRLETVIVRLRMLNPFARFILLSATLGNPQELADWLGGVVFRTTERVVPLRWSTRTFRKADEKPRMLLEALKPVIQRGGKSIVFVQSKRRAEQVSEFLVSSGIRSEFHHAGLDFGSRSSVERAFRSKSFDVLVATATLEVGLNLPARQVVLYDLQQFQGGEFHPLSVISAWQRAGRAGRPGMDDQGEVVILRAKWEKDQRYEDGRFESIRSALSNRSQLSEQIVVTFGSGLVRTAPELQSLMAKSLLAKQGRLPCLRSLINQMAEAGFLEEVTAKNESRLRATRLGRMCTRLMVSPDALVRVRELLRQSVAWTFFDLLLLAMIAGDGEGLLSVDYEELERLSELINTNRSAWLTKLAALNASGELSTLSSPKRLLLSLKAAAALSAWTSGTPMDVVADRYCAYVGDLDRLRESCLRMLGAILAFVGLPASDDESVSSALRSTIPATNKSWLTAKLKRLIMMVDAGLDQDLVTLTLVSGVGQTWARRLGEIGIRHVEDLAQSEPSQVSQVGKVSLKRATRWIEDAAKLLQSEELLAHEDSASWASLTATSRDVGFDVYRLRRSWGLQVVRQSLTNEFQVTGGLDPHTVRRIEGGWQCDCLDAAKGNVCKHQLAARRTAEDPAVLNADLLMRAPSVHSTLNLTELWSR